MKVEEQEGKHVNVLVSLVIWSRILECWEWPAHDPVISVSKVFSGLQDASDHPFFLGPEEEGRLVFSLLVDSFNLFHMKTAKQKVSLMGI